MRGTEDNLELSKYDPAGWVDLVKKQLKGNARNWWDALEVVLVKPISWATFKARFDTRYFPEASKRQLAEQFLQLKQNGRSVEEYHQEYVKLARFAPELVKKQLKDNARNWWDTVEAVLVKPITWATFKARFDARYFPKAAKKDLAEEFLHLRQNGRPVEIYHQEYVKLARYAPNLVKEDEDNVERFLRGMDLRLSNRMTTTDIESYDKLLVAGTRQEKSMLAKDAASGKGKRPMEQSRAGAGAHSFDCIPPVAGIIL